MKLVHCGIARRDEQRVTGIDGADPMLVPDGPAVRQTTLDETSVDPELVACGDGEWRGGQFSSYENFFVAAS